MDLFSPFHRQLSLSSSFPMPSHHQLNLSPPFPMPSHHQLSLFPFSTLPMSSYHQQYPCIFHFLLSVPGARWEGSLLARCHTTSPDSPNFCLLSPWCARRRCIFRKFCGSCFPAGELFLFFCSSSFVSLSLLFLFLLIIFPHPLFYSLYPRKKMRVSKKGREMWKTKDV